MSRSLARFLGLALVATLVTSACKSLGTPEDRTRAADLWEAIEGYQEWGPFPGREGLQPGETVHGDTVRVWVNGTAAANTADLPPGSILVKEGYGDDAGTDLNAITVMQRIAGYDPENEDWFYARFSSGGELTHAGAVNLCIDCHFESDDFVFFND